MIRHLRARPTISLKESNGSCNFFLKTSVTSARSGRVLFQLTFLIFLVFKPKLTLYKETGYIHLKDQQMLITLVLTFLFSSLHKFYPKMVIFWLFSLLLLVIVSNNY